MRKGEEKVAQITPPPPPNNTLQTLNWTPDPGTPASPGHRCRTRPRTPGTPPPRPRPPTPAWPAQARILGGIDPRPDQPPPILIVVITELPKAHRKCSPKQHPSLEPTRSPSQGRHVGGAHLSGWQRSCRDRQLAHRPARHCRERGRRRGWGRGRSPLDDDGAILRPESPVAGGRLGVASHLLWSQAAGMGGMGHCARHQLPLWARCGHHAKAASGVC